MVFLQIKDPLDLFMKSGKFLPGSRFISHLYMILAVEKQRKTPFLPSFR